MRARQAVEYGLLGCFMAIHWAWGATYFVDASRPDDSGDGRSWATAKKTIQAAVDLTVDGDTVVVASGIYDLGGRPGPGSSLTNRVVITNDITVRGIDGPQHTVIRGQGPLGDAAVRCVWMAKGRLEGFTLREGYTRTSGDLTKDRSGGGALVLGGALSNCLVGANTAHGLGGGIYGGTLYNCTVVGNSAQLDGGGASGATLNNCFVQFNSATWGGGGTASCTMYNCVLTGNSAGFVGGGAKGGTLFNCTIVNNTAEEGGGGIYGGTAYNSIIVYNTYPNYEESTLRYCCSQPLPPGDGNKDADPLFQNGPGANFRLLAGSPCIDAGQNGWGFPAGPPCDMDGTPRVVGPRIDMGAYEFPFTPAGVHYAWLQQYGLPIDGSVDQVDLDGDGALTWQEYVTDTVPTNTASVFRLRISDDGRVLTWHSSNGRRYTLEQTTNLAAGTFMPIPNAVDLPATPPQNSFTNESANSSPAFFRAKVRLEH